jgi:hypothetical protein
MLSCFSPALRFSGDDIFSSPSSLILENVIPAVAGIHTGSVTTPMGIGNYEIFVKMFDVS